MLEDNVLTGLSDAIGWMCYNIFKLYDEFFIFQVFLGGIVLVFLLIRIFVKMTEEIIPND
jgi:hypothetical protein